jgi:hypothetical protein
MRRAAILAVVALVGSSGCSPASATSPFVTDSGTSPASDASQGTAPNDGSVSSDDASGRFEAGESRDAADASEVIEDSGTSPDDAGYCNVSGIHIHCTPEGPEAGACGAGYILMGCCVGSIAGECFPFDGSLGGVCCPD